MQFRPAFSLTLLLLAFTLASCDGYQKLLKSNDRELKERAAISYYDQGKYFKAQPLLEELYSIYIGYPKADTYYYYFCHTHRGLGEYILAAYRFKDYTRRFPAGSFSEDALYLHAECYSLAAPEASLDQAYTRKAISAFQLFINTYPESPLVGQANKLMDTLNYRLETKSRNSADLYYDMGNYKASVAAYKNLLNEYPDSRDVEVIMYRIARAAFLLAKNSLANKALARYEDAILEGQAFQERFPESSRIRDTQQMIESSRKAIKDLQLNG